MLEAVQRDGIDLIAVPDLERDLGIIVAFTGRQGGTSRPPFERLNLAYDVGDEREAVTSNRLLLGKALSCLLYTSDAADDLLCVDLGGRRIIKKKKKKTKKNNKQ